MRNHEHTAENLVGPDPEQDLARSKLRLLEMKRGQTWPDRYACEIILVLNCRSSGFQLQDEKQVLAVGETAMLPLGNGLVASAEGHVLSARIEALQAPSQVIKLNDRLIAQLMRRAWASKEVCGEIVAPTLGLIEVLAAQTIRQHQEKLDFLEGIDARIVAALAYIDRNFSTSLDISELAKVAFLSRSHFARLFKDATGEPVWSYIRRVRCEKAREMLLSSNDSLVDIAFRTGFANQSHLTQSFKSQFGQSPGAMRSRLRAER